MAFKNTMKFLVIMMLLSGMIFTAAVYAEEENSPKNESDTPKAMTPIFPESNPALIFVEGEDAVSTNFDKEPKLNYGCSGMRTLQLNQANEPTGGLSYYADYVFYVEEPGTYELVYGGTPPGPKDTLIPSFVSPFTCDFDNSGRPQAVYRENDIVIENYTPVYYWNVFGERTLDSGMHTIRFEVKEKRRYDSRYYFYIDCFFLVRKEGARRLIGKQVPDVFPKNLDDRRANIPFRSLDDLEIAVRDNPHEIQPLIEISRIYSLAGDNLQAVKYLKRAFNIDPENIEALLLLAKNDIWRNEIGEGLDFYSEVLSIDPSRLTLWLEAGKVSGWTRRYDESVEFFKAGLARFPGNLELLANLGLTYLWAGNTSEAETTFKRLQTAVASDSAGQKRLGRIFFVNGYPDMAEIYYKVAVSTAPKEIESYLALENIYYFTNRKDLLREMKDLVSKSFVSSERLSRYLALFDEKLVIKEKAIEGYEARLKANPDDLGLRELLSQAYFWSGRKRDAIFESLNLLAYYLYRDLSDNDRKAFDYLETIDKIEASASILSSLPDRIAVKQKEIGTQIEKYSAAKRARESLDSKEKSGESVDKEEGQAAIERLENEEAALRSLLRESYGLTEQYKRAAGAAASLLETAKLLEVQNESEQKLFEKRTSQIKWAWDRQGYVSELTDVANLGFALAYNVLARIAIAEGAARSGISLALKAKESVSTKELEYSLVQGYVHTGELARAIEVYESSKVNLDVYAPYLPNFIAFVKSLANVVSDSQESPGDLVSAARETMTSLTNVAKDSYAPLRVARESASDLQKAYKQKLVRGFLEYEEKTYPMRAELGDFFSVEDAGRAIAQYKKVLAIDPWDMAALYSIGKAYEKNGQWQLAMDYYKRVFWADPVYEDAAERYNVLAREHADSIDVSASFLADTAKISWGALSSYSIELNEFLGFLASYEGTNVRIYRWDPNRSSGNPNIGNYFVQSLVFGTPITIKSIGLVLTPQAGVSSSLNDDFYGREGPPDTFPTPNVTPLDFLLYSNYYPKARLDYSYDAGGAVSAFGTAYFELQEETLGFNRSKVYESSLNCNLSVSLAPTKLPVVENASFRLYGEGHYMFDSNIGNGFNLTWAALAELAYKFFETEQPSISLSIFANAYFEDSTIEKLEGEYSMIDYFAPQEVFVSGGGLSFSSYFGLPDGNALGFGLACGAYYASQFELYPLPGELKSRLKLQVNASFEYSRSGSTLYVRPEFVMLPNIMSGYMWDYWDFSVTAGCAVSLPSLLAK